MPKNLICLSHLRWDFVYQRPQHLLSRFARQSAVYFYEEPIFTDSTQSHLQVSPRGENLNIVVPHLPKGLDEAQTDSILAELFDEFISAFELQQTVFWYYTPMALKYSGQHAPKAIIYDCMDELSGFKFAHGQIAAYERQLLEMADVVFTGGHSLYQAKKQYHNNIHPFPSSIDRQHFASASTTAEAHDQVYIPGPKIGFFGVIDERFDTALIADLATLRPDWNIILIGPVVKIDPASLPRHHNIHYLGQKSYVELPAYLSGWDVAMLPFLLNESTRFISPTKTPEYLAAGIPVVSTAIHDVVNPYGEQGLVHICPDAQTFAQAIETELQLEDKRAWQEKVTEFLSDISWDKTQSDMAQHIKSCVNKNHQISIAS